MLKSKMPFIVAALLGVLAFIVSLTAIRKREADVRKGWKLEPVVVASVDISEGSVVKSDMLASRMVPEQFVTSSVVKPDSVGYVINQRVLVPLQTGDTLLWSQFETTRATNRLSSKIQKKTRAITIQVDMSTAVGGWVQPNDHVDIIGSFRDPKTDEQIAVTLLQNVIVLATGKTTGMSNMSLTTEKQHDYGNVSLLVIPEEAEIVTLAQDLGKLTMSLRNPEDIDVLADRGRATIHTLLSGERTKALQRKRFEAIQIIRGTQATKAIAPMP